MTNGDDQAIGEMRAEVRALTRMIEQHDAEEVRWREKLDERLNDYSKRIRVLERWRDAMVGGAVVLGVVWGAIKAGAGLLAAFVTGR